MEGRVAARFLPPLVLLALHLCVAGVEERASGGSGVQDLVSETGRSAGFVGHHGGQRAARLRKLYAATESETWNLRVCNAYAFGSAVDIFKGAAPQATEKLTAKTGPLPFKQCFDLDKVPLHPGDKLEFLVGGDLHLGTFAVTNIPEGAMLQLVIMRHDEMTTAASFMSHVFVDSYAPQIAVVDAYVGPSRSMLKIGRLEEDREGEEVPVHYNRLVTLQPGTYRWHLLDSLVGREETQAAAVDHQAESWGRYTAIRMGIKAHQGPSFEEDLIVFPGGTPVYHRSGAAGLRAVGPAVVAAVVLAVVSPLVRVEL